LPPSTGEGGNSRGGKELVASHGAGAIAEPGKVGKRVRNIRDNQLFQEIIVHPRHSCLYGI
jgi:hypothetical protein